MVNKRPMDNVSVGFDDAQEDEFALLKLTLDSPLMNFIFPEKKGYFISNYEDFNPSQEYYSIWKEKMTGFCKKVVRNSGRTILLKNPAHSLRIPLLRELFPKARFIHIHRHPFDVVPSSMHLWETLLKDNLLKGKPEIPDVEEVARGLNKFYSLISRDMALIPKGYKSVIAYEDLIQDPVKCIRKCYHDLKVQFTDDFELSIHAYMQQNKAFRKKSYTFGNEDKEKVYQEMKRFFKLHNYSMHP
jgi:hypothetical protein